MKSKYEIIIEKSLQKEEEMLLSTLKTVANSKNRENHKVGNQVGNLSFGLDHRRTFQTKLEDVPNQNNFELELLRTICEVQHLLTQDFVPIKLIENVCSTLTSRKAIDNCWIALFDDYNNCTAISESKMGDGFIHILDQLNSGLQPNCLQLLLNENESKNITLKVANDCENCQLTKENYFRKTIVNKIEYEGQLFGNLNFSINSKLALTQENRNLISRVCNLIGKALYDYAESSNQNVESNKFYLKNKFEFPSETGMAVLDGEHVVSVNSNLTEILGVDLTGKTIEEVTVNENEYKILVKQLIKFAYKNSTSFVDSKFRTSSGEIIDVNIEANLVSENHHKNLVLIIKNMSAKNKVNNLIKRTKSAIDVTSDAIIFWNRVSKKIEDYNSVFLKFCNKNSSEIKGNNLLDFLPLISDAEFEEYLMQQDFKPTDSHLETIFSVSDDKVIPIELKATPLKNENNNLVVVAIKNVSEINLAKRQIQKFTMALEKVPVSVLMTDTEGHIQYANNHFLDSTGFTYSEVLGNHTNIIKSGHNSTDTYKRLWNTLKNGDVWNGELINRKRDNSIYRANTSIYPIFDVFGKITNFLSVSVDITQQKEIEKELQINRSRADINEKLKSEFLAQMSHEIRTPINVLLSYSSIIRDEFEDYKNDEIEECFELMENAGHRLIRTVDLILNLSELESGSYERKLRQFDVFSEIVKPLHSEFKYIANQKDIKFSVKSFTKDLLISNDLHSTTQILRNLIENAIKYTNKGGVELVIKRNNLRNLVIELNDSGIGISEEYQAKLFEPFSQEEGGYTRTYEGNGLGLALVKRYCDLNNIKINFKSQKNIGTKFILTFK